MRYQLEDGSTIDCVKKDAWNRIAPEGKKIVKEVE